MGITNQHLVASLQYSVIAFLNLLTRTFAVYGYCTNKLVQGHAPAVKSLRWLAERKERDRKRARGELRKSAGGGFDHAGADLFASMFG